MKEPSGPHPFYLDPEGDGEDWQGELVVDPVVNGLRRSMRTRRYLRSTNGRTQIKRFVDNVSEGTEGTDYAQVPPGVNRNILRWMTDAVNGEIFILDEHMGDIALQRAIASKSAELGPHEPIAPEGVIWFPNPMPAICRNLHALTGGVISGSEDIDGADALVDAITEHPVWMTHESGIQSPDLDKDSELRFGIGTDLIAGIAWKVHGDMVTLIWLIYPFHSRFMYIKAFYDRIPFISPAWNGPYNLEKSIDDLIEFDAPAHDVFPIHYWTCQISNKKFGALPRPDQPGARKAGPASIPAYNNVDGKSKRIMLDVDEEMADDCDSINWLMISFGCELLRLMSQEITVRAPIERSTAGRNFQRTVKKELGEKRAREGVRTFVLRKIAGDNDDDAGVGTRPRGPLTTRHVRRGHWRGIQKRAGDPLCAHRWKGSSVRGTWRVCKDCHRSETFIGEAEVGPEDAPWSYAVKVGLVTR